MSALTGTSVEREPAVSNGVLEKLDLAHAHMPPPPFDSRLATTARVMFIVLSSLALVYFARSVVVPVLLAWFVSMMLKPPVRALRHVGIPIPVGAALVVSIVVVAVCYGAIHLGRPALVWLNAAPDNLPQIRKKFQHVLRPAVKLSEAASSVGRLTPPSEPRTPPQPVEVKDNRVVNTVFTWTGSFLTGAGETVALVFLLLAFGDFFMAKVVRILPTLSEKKQAVGISQDIHQAVSKYLFCVGVLNVCFGIAVALALHLVGMPNPMMWGAVAALLNFIPYFGPVVGVIALGLGGLLAYDTVGAALLPACLYLLIHLVEANFITPVVLGRRFTLNPVIIFVALIFCIWLWGVVGALLAVPLLVTLRILCAHVPALGTLGELLSGVKDPIPSARSLA